MPTVTVQTQSVVMFTVTVTVKVAVWYDNILQHTPAWYS